MNLPISPLSLDALTRDTWGSFDAAAMQQIARIGNDPCYRPKLYKSPDSATEVVPANGYVSHGLRITPGSLIYGFYLPLQVFTTTPVQFNVQVTDQSLSLKGHPPRTLFDEPVPAWFLSNYKPTYLGADLTQAGSFPNLLCAPYPVVGNGLFLVEIWDSSGSQQRIELVIGTFEPTEDQ